MKLAPFVILLLVAGCQKPDAEPAPAPTPAAAAPSKAPAAGGPGTTVQQMTPTNIGGATPVAGTESLDGAGSAAGQVLKNKAKNLPGAANNPNPAPPAPGEENPGN